MQGSEEKKCVVVEIGGLRGIKAMCDKEEELTNELTAGLDKRNAKKIEKMINVGLLMLHNNPPTSSISKRNAVSLPRNGWRRRRKRRRRRR